MSDKYRDTIAASNINADDEKIKIAVAKILDEHMTILEKAVNEAGFSLKNEVIMREPTLNTSGSMVVDEMFGVDLEQSVKRYSFDVRM